MGRDKVIAHIVRSEYLSPAVRVAAARRFRKREQTTDQTAADSFGATTIRPPLDPELAPVEEARSAVFPALSDETLPEIRRQIAEGSPGLDSEALTAGGRVRVEERQAPGPEGAPDITLLILSLVEDRGPKGGIVHIHGGGMIMGDRRAHLSNLLTHVIDGSAVVVSVEYRLASEHPDPAPVEDCYAGLAWTAKNAAELGIDPERLMITGISGGGGDRAARPRRRMGAEGFRDEILIYAGRLSEAGVSVDPHMWAGGFHSFDMIAGQAAVPRASIATREEFIRRALDA